MDYRTHFASELNAATLTCRAYWVAVALGCTKEREAYVPRSVARSSRRSTLESFIEQWKARLIFYQVVPSLKSQVQKSLEAFSDRPWSHPGAGLRNLSSTLQEALESATEEQIARTLNQVDLFPRIAFIARLWLGLSSDETSALLKPALPDLIESAWQSALADLYTKLATKNMGAVSPIVSPEDLQDTDARATTTEISSAISNNLA